MSSPASGFTARRTSRYFGILNTHDFTAAAPAPFNERRGDGVPCEVSLSCQDEMRRKLKNPQDYVELGCWPDLRYFSCLCGKTNSLGANWYFDAHCHFLECGEATKKTAFVAAYRDACDQANKKLIDITPEWLPFAQGPPLPQTSSSSAPTSPPPPPPSPSTVDSPPTIATPPETASLSMSTTTSGAKTTSPAASSTSKGPLTSLSTATTTESVGPSSSYGAGFQFPICNIAYKCMKNGDNKPMCNQIDFKCICNVSNSMANNTQFDQQCVLDDCMGDIGKEEFIAYLIYQCRLANKTLVDIPKQWQPYLPDSYQTSSAVPPSSNATATASAVLAFTNSPYSLTDGAKAGIGVGVVFAVAILAALGVTFYRAKKKVKQVQKRNAELVDRQSAHGVTAYIRNLTGKSTTSLPITEGGTTMVGEPQFKSMKELPGSPTWAKPAVPWSEGPSSLQRQYSESDYGDEISAIRQDGGGVWDKVHGEGSSGHSGVASGYMEHSQPGRRGAYP